MVWTAHIDKKNDLNVGMFGPPLRGICPSLLHSREMKDFMDCSLLHEMCLMRLTVLHESLFWHFCLWDATRIYLCLAVVVYLNSLECYLWSRNRLLKLQTACECSHWEFSILIATLHIERLLKLHAIEQRVRLFPELVFSFFGLNSLVYSAQLQETNSNMGLQPSDEHLCLYRYLSIGEHPSVLVNVIMD